MTICMTHAEREALQFDLEACRLSLSLPVCLSAPSLRSERNRSQIASELQSQKTKAKKNDKLKCALNVKVNVVGFFFVFVFAMSHSPCGEIKMRFSSTLEVLSARWFWGQQDTWLVKRRAVRNQHTFIDLQQVRDEARCCGDAARLFIITCEPDQVQIVHTDD